MLFFWLLFCKRYLCTVAWAAPTVERKNPTVNLLAALKTSCKDESNALSRSRKGCFTHRCTAIGYAFAAVVCSCFHPAASTSNTHWDPTITLFSAQTRDISEQMLLQSLLQEVLQQATQFRWPRQKFFNFYLDSYLRGYCTKMYFDFEGQKH